MCCWRRFCSRCNRAARVCTPPLTERARCSQEDRRFVAISEERRTERRVQKHLNSRRDLWQASPQSGNSRANASRLSGVGSVARSWRPNWSDRRSGRSRLRSAGAPTPEGAPGRRSIRRRPTKVYKTLVSGSRPYHSSCCGMDVNCRRPSSGARRRGAQERMHCRQGSRMNKLSGNGKKQVQQFSGGAPLRRRRHLLQATITRVRLPRADPRGR
jgi:hypothetical protein